MASDTLPVLRRVLVADDEHLITTGLQASLTALRYEPVGPAADGQAALEVARAERPDLALLDIRMPVMDGLDCAAQLWNELSIPSVIISAYSSQNYVDRALTTGVYGYLLKPVSTESLRVTLSVAWARANAERMASARVVQLENNLTERRTVEAAKWKLVQSQGLSEPAAHAYLQQRARSNRRKLIEVAQEILGDA
jgi:response regulator NasT